MLVPVGVLLSCAALPSDPTGRRPLGLQAMYSATLDVNRLQSRIVECRAPHIGD